MIIGHFLNMLHNRLQRETIYSRPAYWDEKAGAYDGNAVSMWPNNALNRLYHDEQIQVLKRLAEDIDGREILDVGCGTGRISRFLAAGGARVTGIDFSPRTIAIAARQSSADHPAYRVQSIFELDESGVYDIIVVWGVLTVACTCRAQLLDALMRIRRALKPGGRMILMEPVHKGFLHRVLDMGLDDFKKTLCDAGLSITRCTTLHFWPMRLVLAYVPWPASFTYLGYVAGQRMMKAFFGNRAMGDYTAIEAERP